MELIAGILDGSMSLADLIRWGGYTVLVAIVFCETGLLVGFFLPGDSLLITAGLMAAAGTLDIWWQLLLVFFLIFCGTGHCFVLQIQLPINRHFPFFAQIQPVFA